MRGRWRVGERFKTHEVLLRYVQKPKGRRILKVRRGSTTDTFLCFCGMGHVNRLRQNKVEDECGTAFIYTYVEKFAVAEARSGSRLPFTGKKGQDPAWRAPNGIGCLGPKVSNGIVCRPNSVSWATRGARA